MTDMDKAISVTLGVEGDWSDHPADPGGKTKYGITEKTFHQAVKLGLCANWNNGVAGLQINEARKIYEFMYWRVARGDDLPTGLNALIFDFQVNSGQGGRRLQASLNYLYGSGLRADNAIGSATLGALRRVLEAHPERVYDIMYEASARRFIHWTSLFNWSSFRWGWARRGARILGHCVIMAKEKEYA